MSDPKANNSTLSYDGLGRVTTETDRLGYATQRAYGVLGNLASLTDAEGQLTQYEYDGLGRQARTIWPDHVGGSVPGDIGYGITETDYDSLGRLLRRTDQQGATITFVYDAAGRITQRDYRTRANSPSGPIADSDTFTHDDADRLLSATKGRYGNTLAFSHDSAGRISGESLTAHSQTYTIGRDYDAAGNLTRITQPDGTLVDRGFTARNELDNVQRNSALVASFAYDPGMRETSRSFANGLTTNTTWLDDNRVDTIANTAVGTHDYAYDANGNRTAETISGPMSGYGWSTGASGYDAEDRLINWDRTDGNLSQDWNLSKVGDWNSLITNGTTQNRTHGPAHELTAIATQPLTYDSRGNLASDNQARSFVWDADNFLESVNVSTGAPFGQVGTHSYEYDALGRRVSKTSGSTTTVYINLTLSIPPLGPPGGQIIAEYTAGTAATNPLRETIYGSYVDEPLAIIDGPTSNTHYYHQNARYDIVALSGTAGTIVERYAYDAYGNTLILDGTGTTLRTTSQYANRFAFTGRELDDESGLYYFRARYYDARFGRFMGRDPIGYSETASLYCFVSNSPFRNADPAGTQRMPVDFRDDNGCCKIKDVKLVCRTMPAAGHLPGMTHCYLAFSNGDLTDAGGEWDDTISGQQDEASGKTVFSDSFWDRNWANDDKTWVKEHGDGLLNDYYQYSYPLLIPLKMDPCAAYACMFRAATRLSGVHDYNQYTDNSNTFLTRAMRACGLLANFPASAIGSDDLPGLLNPPGCLRRCLGESIITATAAEIGRCQSRCAQFKNSDPVVF